jgi:hypothetical protein
MIDRSTRDKLAKLLEQHIRGEPANEQFDKLAMTGSDDPVIWAVLNKDLELPLDSGGNPVLGNPATQRKVRMIERCILFLKTDREYQWERTVLPWWSLLLLPFVLAALALMMFLAFLAAEPISAFLSRLGIEVEFAQIFVWLSFAMAVLLYLAHHRLLGADSRCWPFYRRRDYVEALARDPWASPT